MSQRQHLKFTCAQKPERRREQALQRPGENLAGEGGTKREGPKGTDGEQRRGEARAEPHGLSSVGVPGAAPRPDSHPLRAPSWLLR